MVNAKTGPRWRRKRGTVKPAVLNAALAANANNARLCVPAAKRMMEKLQPFMHRFATGKNVQLFASYLSKSIIAGGPADYRFFLRHEMQTDHPLDKILEVPYKAVIKKGMMEVRLPLKNDPVKKYNPLVTEYYFELVLLQGDPMKEDSLRVESDASPIYLFDTSYTKHCVLQLQIPEGVPFILLLKAGCNEGDQPAMHAKHYGMRVVGVG